MPYRVLIWVIIVVDLMLVAATVGGAASVVRYLSAPAEAATGDVFRGDQP